MRRIFACALAIFIGVACAAEPARPGAPATTAAAPSALPSATAVAVVAPRDIAAAGRLRVAIISNDVGFIAKDPTTGEPKGVGVDIGREVARRFGVTFIPVDVATYPAAAAALKAGTADMVLVTPTPERQAELDFTQPLVETDLTYLAPAGLRVTTAAQIDQAGLRIVVRKGTGTDATLTEIVKKAQIVRVDGSLDDALAVVRSGGADVVAGARSNLVVLKTKLTGSSVLDGRFGVTQWALAMPKGKADLLMPVAQVAREIAESELVTISIIRTEALGLQPALP